MPDIIAHIIVHDCWWVLLAACQMEMQQRRVGAVERLQHVTGGATDADHRCVRQHPLSAPGGVHFYEVGTPHRNLLTPRESRSVPALSGVIFADDHLGAYGAYGKYGTRGKYGQYGKYGR